MDAQTERLVAWTLILSPSIPLILAWRRHCTSGKFDRTSTYLLAIVTASYLLLWLAEFFVPVLGPFYSSRRFITIEGNLGLNLLLAIMGVIRQTPWRNRMCLSSIGALVALAWLYVLAINSVV